MTSRPPSWQLVVAPLVALAAVVLPIAAGLHPVQGVASGIGGGLFTYLMRGRERARRDLVLGVGLIVLLGLVGVAQAAPAAAVAWWGTMPLGWVLRGEREGRRNPSTLTQPLTGWRGWAALSFFGVMIVASVVYAAATIRSREDVVGLLGPPAAVAIAGVIGSVVVLLRRVQVTRGVDGWAERAGSEVPAVQRAVTAERELDVVERPTRADDGSLDRARDHAEMAVLFLGSGPRLEAVQELERLLHEAESWDPAAPLTRQVAGLEGLVRRGRRARGRVDTELRRDASAG